MLVTNPDSHSTVPHGSESQSNLPADPVLAKTIESIIVQGKRMSASQGIALFPEPSAWYPQSKTQIIVLQALDAAREIPSSDFMKIGKVQTSILEQVELHNGEAQPEEQFNVTYIADGSGIYVDGNFSNIDNIAAKLVEHPAFRSQIMILPGTIIQTIMNGAIKLMSIGERYRGKFFVVGSMQEALQLNQALNTPTKEN